MIFQAASVIMRREMPCQSRGEARGRGAAVLGQLGRSICRRSSSRLWTAAAAECGSV